MLVSPFLAIIERCLLILVETWQCQVIMTLFRTSQVVTCRWMDIVRIIDACL